nr:MAG TPA: hypothetical protein [Caudoviricetes sp.]
MQEYRLSILSLLFYCHLSLLRFCDIVNMYPVTPNNSVTNF